MATRMMTPERRVGCTEENGIRLLRRTCGSLPAIDPMTAPAIVPPLAAALSELAAAAGAAGGAGGGRAGPIGGVGMFPGKRFTN